MSKREIWAATTGGQTPQKDWDTGKSSKSLENWTLMTPSAEKALIS